MQIIWHAPIYSNNLILEIFHDLILNLEIAIAALGPYSRTSYDIS